MNYEVTIGMPVYHAEKYLRETLLSALAQDEASIEFLIVDDCGTDGSMDIIRQQQQEHPRGKDIRIVTQEFNKGVGAARNRILKEARGKYLYFLDADDIMRPDTISLLLKAAKKYHAEVVMASYQRVELYHEPVAKKDYILPSKVFTEYNDIAKYAFSHYGALNATMCNVLLNMKVIREADIKFVNSNYWEDMVFKYELVTYVSRVVLLPDITYQYMCRENSLSNFQQRKEIAKDEILRNVATIETLKYRYKRLLYKPYFSEWLSFIMKTDYFIICDILSRRERIFPEITDRELRNFLHSPLSLAQTLYHGNTYCFFLKLLSIMPPKFSIYIIQKLKKT